MVTEGIWGTRQRNGMRWKSTEGFRESVWLALADLTLSESSVLTPDTTCFCRQRELTQGRWPHQQRFSRLVFHQRHHHGASILILTAGARRTVNRAMASRPPVSSSLKRLCRNTSLQEDVFAGRLLKASCLIQSKTSLQEVEDFHFLQRRPWPRGDAKKAARRIPEAPV